MAGSFLVFQNQVSRMPQSTSDGTHPSPSGVPSAAVKVPQVFRSYFAPFQHGYGANPSSFPTQRMFAREPWNTMACGAYLSRISDTSKIKLPSNQTSKIGP